MGYAVEVPDPVVVLLRVAALASDATLVRVAEGRWAIRGDPTEGALIVAAAKAGIGEERSRGPVPAHGGDPVQLGAEDG